MNQLAPENLPGFFLAWAKRNRIDVPIALEEAVTNHGSQVADWKTLFDNQSSELARLKSELAELEAKNAAKPAASSEKPLGARERSTLLKIVLGMAMACYEHNPHAGRTTTASAILTDLQTLGIAVSDDTIRKYLAEAVEYAPPADMD
ncbi:MAG: hypothetical protein JJ884_09105 [Maricaulis sp.]|uniref:hypothetical protein n=1 Tax=Maricaulis sp. TaxID=1486257 RepID=UPI001B255355|nr:hypothetical protein [Maricaulis sp.]MBO6697138.1 hypothetical protein [Henriciella sp.]MBO6728113.1 hypothetical protein [Maricaulis sp.]MBO6847664.1 hypothetical protein [Maricaulis sp.]MBO6876909.1 hypothetical protein [Maricaulis sp.]